MTRVGNGTAGLPSMAGYRSKHMALGVCVHSHTRAHARSPCPWRSLGQTQPRAASTPASSPWPLSPCSIPKNHGETGCFQG